MKTVLFISSNKMLGQGLSAAIQSEPKLEFRWGAQLHYTQAIIGVDIFHADVVLLDIVDLTDMEQAAAICETLRREEQAAVRKVAVDAKNAGLADDFVFYDSSLTYLLAKLSAF